MILYSPILLFHAQKVIEKGADCFCAGARQTLVPSFFILEAMATSTLKEKGEVGNKAGSLYGTGTSGVI